ncbi:MAG: hypothetical protein CVU11_08040 [Bacteroidetes bacterium HGW-Bacteroidetes-6]|nr:MAG: hypothetical protein CVU11_08040 [Bacteroidetes bacterium HGW-Bacteroidetes-6]
MMQNVRQKIRTSFFIGMFFIPEQIQEVNVFVFLLKMRYLNPPGQHKYIKTGQIDVNGCFLWIYFSKLEIRFVSARRKCRFFPDLLNLIH